MLVAVNNRRHASECMYGMSGRRVLEVSRQGSFGAGLGATGAPGGHLINVGLYAYLGLIPPNRMAGSVVQCRMGKLLNFVARVLRVPGSARSAVA